MRIFPSNTIYFAQGTLKLFRKITINIEKNSSRSNILELFLYSEKLRNAYLNYLQIHNYILI